jgi:hypothetical protein
MGSGAVICADLMVVVIVMLLVFDLVLVLFRCDGMLVWMLVPIGVMLIDPIGVMVVPPIAIVPFVMLIEVAVASPVRMSFDPFGMVLVHPTGIVLMPPVCLVPSVIGAVCTPSTAVGHLSPDVGMFLHERFQVRMLFPPRLVVDQVGISLDLSPQVGT